VWLVTQGARKFVIVLEKRALPPRTEHRMDRLLAEVDIKILFTSVAKLDSEEEAALFLCETETLAPLEAAFFVSYVRVFICPSQWQEIKVR
jgi:hypothetical protein